MILDNIPDQELSDYKTLCNMLKEDLPDGMGFDEFIDDYEEFNALQEDAEPTLLIKAE